MNLKLSASMYFASQDAEGHLDRARACAVSARMLVIATVSLVASFLHHVYLSLLLWLLLLLLSYSFVVISLAGFRRFHTRYKKSFVFSSWKVD